MLAAYETSQQSIINLEFRTAKERVIYRLLYLGRHYGHQKNTKTQIAMPVIYQDMADSLSLTRETVNRTMMGLIKQGLVRRQGNYVFIENPVKLNQILDM